MSAARVSLVAKAPSTAAANATAPTCLPILTMVTSTSTAEGRAIVGALRLLPALWHPVRRSASGVLDAGGRADAPARRGGSRAWHGAIDSKPSSRASRQL